MIRVAKSVNVPDILIRVGEPETAENCRLYEGNPSAYDEGANKLSISPTIYGDALVKQQLIYEQHEKCCFCEADFTANGYGDVEHFRPKAGFTKIPSGKLIRPGYYWLAYDWNNLFFSCQICNQRFKKNHFPLDDETKRAKNHTFDHHKESPLLIHPSVNNPEDHITFNRHVPIPKTDKGKISINTFGINRPKLNSAREKYLQNVRNNDALARIDFENLTDIQRQQCSQMMNQPWPLLEELIRTAKKFMAVASNDEEPFAAMIRANF